VAVNQRVKCRAVRQGYFAQGANPRLTTPEMGGPTGGISGTVRLGGARMAENTRPPVEPRPPTVGQAYLM
jgi:hypothetical protein